jgi:hypothetical protein
MAETRIRQILQAIADGQLSVEAAMEDLARWPVEDLGHTLVDHHRALRQEIPEIIYGAGKTAAQIAEILGELHRRHGRALATRVNAETASAVRAQHPDVGYDDSSRLLWLGEFPETPDAGPLAVVICAGTSDLPVADEAALTLAWLGHRVLRINDAGVAGLHRLLARLVDLRAADVIVAAAGMEGALPSVIGGLVACPVIAIPTSIGYGIAEGGKTALHAMLTSCASGLAVMNIDNGHGAAILAHRILRKISRS